MRSVFEPLMVSDHSARHGGAMRSMSSRIDRDVLMKSVSSAYSTSSGKAASSGGRVGSSFMTEGHGEQLQGKP